MDMMYPPVMRRLQISVDEDVDEALAVEAARRHTSRAAVIRDLVRTHLHGVTGGDPFAALVGDIDEEPGDIDEVLYGR
jgi:plasmid stability protein